MAIYKAIRTALGAAFLGDTLLAKALPLSSPDVFDDRLITFLAGLQQTIEPKPGTVIEGSDIRSFMAAFHATSNTDRVAVVAALKAHLALFGTGISTTTMCVALGPGPSGAHITDNAAPQVRVSRQGPKAWLVQGLSLFTAATPIETNAPMEWFFVIPQMDDPGVFQDFYNALLGATYLPCSSRLWKFSGESFQDSLSVRTGIGGPTSSKGLFVKSDFFNWAYTAVSADIISQLTLRFSGQVILP